VKPFAPLLQLLNPLTTALSLFRSARIVVGSVPFLSVLFYQTH
jgi:hypothetical protein